MRYLALTTVFILTAICSMAQNYIKFAEATEINGRKFLKGEIYLQIADKKILYGKDTIDLGKTKTERASVDDSYKKSDISLFVEKINKDKYKINVEAFQKQDTIKLLKFDNSVLSFFNKRTDTVSISSCGEVFRIIIPNQPSRVCYKDEFKEPEKGVKNSQEPYKTPEKESFIKNIKWWHYTIGVLLALIIIFFLFILIRRQYINRGKIFPIYEKYNGENFKDFADNNKISRKKLFKYNKILKKNILDNEKLIKELRGRKLIIGYSNFNPEPNKPFDSEYQHNPQKSQSTIETYKKTQNVGELSVQIHQMEDRILNKIDSLSSNREASFKLANQQKEIEELRNKINQQNSEIGKLNQDKTQLNSAYTQVDRIKKEIESEYLKYSDKVIFVDYLEPFAKATYDYYNFCQTGYIKALEYFQKLNHSDSELVSIVSQLLVKFNSNIPNKTNHWVGVINEIKDSKATANIDLIRSLKQIPNNEEKSKEFKRILLKEVFEKYSSSIFILTEEFSNLSKFTNGSTSAVKDFEQFFTRFKSELHSKSKTIGLDLNYVPLFEHYEKYAAFTKLANQTCSLPYKNIKNITKDSVLEIINYGFGNEETNVILA